MYILQILINRINSPYISANSYLVPTPDKLSYYQAWIKPDHHYFEFDLLSCRNAIVRLSSDLFNTGTTDNGAVIVY